MLGAGEGGHLLRSFNHEVDELKCEVFEFIFSVEGLVCLGWGIGSDRLPGPSFRDDVGDRSSKPRRRCRRY
jgi:hypothetical protein